MTRPNLSGLIDGAFRALLSNVHVSLPARIVSYDKDTASCSVKPLLQRAYVGEDGERRVESMPVINSVPVLFQGAGDYSSTFPLKAGDTVALLFSEQSLDQWLVRGGEIDPLDDRSHSLSDAMAIPGLRPFSSTLDDAADDDAWVITVPVDAMIRLGDANADDPVMRKSDADRFMAALNQAIVQAGVGTPIAAALGALQTALQAPPSWVSSMNSQVRVR